MFRSLLDFEKKPMQTINAFWLLLFSIENWLRCFLGQQKCNECPSGRGTGHSFMWSVGFIKEAKIIIETKHEIENGHTLIERKREEEG